MSSAEDRSEFQEERRSQLRILFGSLCFAANMVEFSSEITNFVDFPPPADVDLAHPKRVFHAHDAKSDGTTLRSSTRGAYNHRGAARIARIRACFDVAE